MGTKNSGGSVVVLTGKNMDLFKMMKQLPTFALLLGHDLTVGGEFEVL